MEHNKTLSLKNVIVFVIVIAIIALSIFSLDILMMLFASFVITCAIAPAINKMEKYTENLVCNINTFGINNSKFSDYSSSFNCNY